MQMKSFYEQLLIGQLIYTGWCSDRGAISDAGPGRDLQFGAEKRGRSRCESKPNSVTAQC